MPPYLRSFEKRGCDECHDRTGRPARYQLFNADDQLLGEFCESCANRELKSEQLVAGGIGVVHRTPLSRRRHLGTRTEPTQPVEDHDVVVEEVSGSERADPNRFSQETVPGETGAETQEVTDEHSDGAGGVEHGAGGVPGGGVQSRPDDEREDSGLAAEAGAVDAD
jgi:hypothetical protein